MSLTFWKPGTAGPGSSLDRSAEIEEAIVPYAPANSYLSIQSQQERLPIFKHQLPQYLLQGGWANEGHVVACTQPRRIAATSVAARVATEVGTKLGDEVGYTIRFEDMSDKKATRILYMTDGMLFRETLIDPLLSRYSVIMVDEAHERSVYTDLVLGVLRKIRKKRPSLRIIVSSATLDATKFLDYFNQGTADDECTIISLEGRMYPVEIAYLQEPTPDYVQKAAEVVWNINLQQGPGDVLVFLTGREDIDRCAQELTDMCQNLPPRSTRLTILPLHAGLTTDEQLAIFAPASQGCRKVIVSTNIAEMRIFNPTTALASLATVPISAASATQRAGRAGRTAPGIGYRLYSETVFKNLPTTTSPEITRTDMTTPILQLKSLGIDDLMKFDWVSAPPAETVLRALEGLHAANMIGEDGRLTPMGQQVAECPVEVGIARMLFRSKDMKCGEEILTIAAMVAIQDVFIIPDGAPGALAELERRKFTAEEGDHFTLLNAYNAFVRYGRSSSWCKSHSISFRAMSRAVSIRAQLKKYMQRFNLPIESCEGDVKRLAKCLVSGYWRNGARWNADGTYRSIRGNMMNVIETKQILHVHPTSVLFTRKPRSGWVVFHEMEETKKKQTVANIPLHNTRIFPCSLTFEMGAGQSTAQGSDEKIFHNETPISFSPSVVNQLADRLESSETTPERQSILDSHIRARIHDELEHLRKQEEDVLQQIQHALERENLDREKAVAGEASDSDGTGVGDIRNSAALLGDLEEIKSKVEKYHSNKKSSEYPEVQDSGAAVAECYKKNKDTPLNCWSEVTKFKSAVDGLEQRDGQANTPSAILQVAPIVVDYI
ncbi:P-loop containing nucleoside triphosphate hydrolase protein [Crepidotus variabilis]|uniref:RNA helicase n=1 Tax=Crepidotus variabilis TaxID=179855 RepID=A0A9P6EMB1_9AGAR|nr:P-loop containing nucleoside triphosphate hydrolase protein [Crepidotus variabilis]